MIGVRTSFGLATAAGMLAFVVVGAASGAPIDRTTTWISAPTGRPDLDTAEVRFMGASADGSRVYLQTTQPLTPDDFDGNRGDVYERVGGVTTLVSTATGVVDPETGHASFAAASQDGSSVFFVTSQRLTADDNDFNFVDVYERSGGTTKLVSAPSPAAAADGADVEFAGVSQDGSRVFFATTQNLTSDDADGNRRDLYERSGGTTQLVSAPTGGKDVPDPNSDGVFSFSGASEDGSRVFFITSERLVADDNDSNRHDVYERSAGTTKLVSAPTGVADPDTSSVSSFAGVSADGTRVFFNSLEKLTADDNDTNRPDCYERSGGTTKLISQPTGVPDPDTAGQLSCEGAPSPDGGRVLLQTDMKLTAADNDGGLHDVYERSGGVTTLVSGPTGVADPATAGVEFRGASEDRSHVYFQTTQKLTSDDGDSARTDVYEYSGGTTKLVSGPTGVADPDTDTAFWKGVSRDGSRVFFETSQKLTSDDGDMSRIDVYERADGATNLISKPTGVPDPDTGAVALGGQFVLPGGVSADGSRVFFETAQKMTPDDGDTGRTDVFMAADTTSPETTITDGPSGTTSEHAPTFSFSSSEPDSTFECSVDGEAFADCTSPRTLASLADGPHSFAVRALDNVGNLDPSPATRSFTVQTPAGAPDATAAVFSSYRLSPEVFRAASRGASIARRRPIGTRVSYTLSEPATVSFKVERAAKGRRVGGRCRRPTRRNRNRRPCTRHTTLSGSFKHTGSGGANRFKFTGRLRGRKLRPGAYRLRARAIDAASNASPVARKKFRIVRR